MASEHQALGYSRSLDGGATFDPARAIPAVDGTEIDAPMVAAGRDGLVAAIYAVGDQGQSQDPDAEAASGDAQEPGGDTYRQIEVVCSTDAGQSFETPVSHWFTSTGQWSGWLISTARPGLPARPGSPTRGPSAGRAQARLVEVAAEQHQGSDLRHGTVIPGGYDGCASDPGSSATARIGALRLRAGAAR